MFFACVRVDMTNVFAYKNSTDDPFNEKNCWIEFWEHKRKIEKRTEADSKGEQEKEPYNSLNDFNC